jgi:hypothetical protein
MAPAVVKVEVSVQERKFARSSILNFSVVNDPAEIGFKKTITMTWFNS